MKKHIFYTEAAYFVGLLLLALGTALTAYGGFGISMVVAPAYILHLFLSPHFPFFSFGVAEYCMQAVILLLLTLLLRKAKLSYLLSFAAAIIYGFLLDGAMHLTSLLPVNLFLQVAAYLLGVGLCTFSIALLFASYLPPAASEMFVKEFSQELHKPIHRIKTFYDCASLALALILSLAFFGNIQGIGIGTILCALCYGTIIRFWATCFEKRLCFTDKFPLRHYFKNER